MADSVGWFHKLRGFHCSRQTFDQLLNKQTTNASNYPVRQQCCPPNTLLSPFPHPFFDRRPWQRQSVAIAEAIKLKLEPPHDGTHNLIQAGDISLDFPMHQLPCTTSQVPLLYKSQLINCIHDAALCHRNPKCDTGSVMRHTRLKGFHCWQNVI